MEETGLNVYCMNQFFKTSQNYSKIEGNTTFLKELIGRSMSSALSLWSKLAQNKYSICSEPMSTVMISFPGAKHTYDRIPPEGGIEEL